MKKHFSAALLILLSLAGAPAWAQNAAPSSATQTSGAPCPPQEEQPCPQCAAIATAAAGPVETAAAASVQPVSTPAAPATLQEAVYAVCRDYRDYPLYRLRTLALEQMQDFMAYYHLPFEDYGVPLSDDERTAIYLYTGTCYRDMNPLLWSGMSEDPRYRALFTVMNSALRKLKPLRDRVVRRGVSLPPEVLAQHQVGHVVTYTAYTSTSLTQPFQGCEQLTIRSLTGRSVLRFSPSSQEDEVIFLPGTRFRVTARHDPPQGEECPVQITMEEVE